ncbi:MAG TPA: hypothetical protein VKU41_23010 [Polyangiaceae bacterium]|nr:hypothetical protein [Polyangiaceae bacterium]
MDTGVGNARRAGFALLGLMVACGGSVHDVPGDHHDAAVPSGTPRVDAGTPSGESDATFSPPSLVLQDSGAGVGEECFGGTLPAPQSPDLKACWPCIAKGCPRQIAACGADCVCNGAITSAFACAEDGGSTGSCLGPHIPDQGQTGEFVNCMLSAISECGCGLDSGGAIPLAGPTDDAGCIQSSGGGISGNGQCSSTVSETCGGILYQATCVCPAGSCACFGPSTRTLIAFDGCPFCPGLGSRNPGGTTVTDILSLCGFP